MKRRHPTLPYLLIAIASIVSATLQPPHFVAPESAAVALADISWDDVLEPAAP